MWYVVGCTFRPWCYCVSFYPPWCQSSTGRRAVGRRSSRVECYVMWPCSTWRGPSTAWHISGATGRMTDASTPPRTLAWRSRRAVRATTTTTTSFRQTTRPASTAGGWTRPHSSLTSWHCLVWRVIARPCPRTWCIGACSVLVMVPLVSAAGNDDSRVHTIEPCVYTLRPACWSDLVFQPKISANGHVTWTTRPFHDGRNIFLPWVIFFTPDEAVYHIW